ncbi:MAG: asparagine synthase (glutamine-hydrolyzing) [Kofleriaceae bacterium]
MCGIAGFLDVDGGDPSAAAAMARQMAAPLAPRGPDDEGAWGGPGVGLGFRRLAIVDLSPTGRQPMTSASGRYTLIFNGEIYNHGALRQALERGGARFRGRSDTEVILASIEADGFEATLPKLTGMFALAVWDAHARALTVARDRFGEKPLYLGWARGGRLLLFGSELKALRAHPAFAPALDRTALLAYVRFGYVPAPRSIYRDVSKLPAGCWQRFYADGRVSAVVPYYAFAEVAAAGLAAPLDVDVGAAADLVEAALTRAVQAQMVADVPLGAFLSGGIDSSLITMLMQRHSPRPVHTFSIGFDQARYDESAYARDVATRLGTDHTEFRVTGAQALAVIPDLPTVYDEPMADSSQIPTLLVSRLARQHVTVVLAGDGGDEVFAGYPRYQQLRQVAAALRVPGRRPLVAAADRLFAALQDRSVTPGPMQRRLDWLRRRTDIGRVRDADAFHGKLMSLWYQPAWALPGVAEARGVVPLAKDVLADGNVTERAMYAETLANLPDDLLVKVDRAAMSTGLETRLPFLDHEVVALAWRLPFATKVGGARGKLVLRHILDKQLPMALFERPKMGFMIPLADWLRGPLRPWAEALLDERRLREAGLFDPVPIRRRWHGFLAGVDDWRSSLWPILVWQQWAAATGLGPPV